MKTEVDHRGELCLVGGYGSAAATLRSGIAGVAGSLTTNADAPSNLQLRPKAKHTQKSADAASNNEITFLV